MKRQLAGVKHRSLIQEGNEARIGSCFGSKIRYGEVRLDHVIPGKKLKLWAPVLTLGIYKCELDRQPTKAVAMY